MFLTILQIIPVSAQNPPDLREDTLAILHYEIRVDITDISSRQIKGITTIKALNRVSNPPSMRLDLLGLQVDSVFVNEQQTLWAYDDTLLRITIPNSLQPGDTVWVRIHYQGQPVMDPSGWGGFYFTGSNFAYNLGVGFAADPHNFGRVWFPCYDNFTSRAKYDFYITCEGSKKALCNGLLREVIHNPDGTATYHWKLHQTIPTYLASMAVGPYIFIEDTFSGNRGKVPVLLGSPPGDSVSLKQSFTHLDECFSGFESAYGDYRWDRVGFVLVPFNSGAMEHATNIAYPRFAADGSLTYETLMAHEFSHHWWGNLVTCATAGDMWINEGWATWSEFLFLENLYGRERYNEAVVANHRQVLQYAHIRDEGHRAVSGVPHAYTYGMTVYDKGADVVHTLRGYMGDSLFFPCIQNFLNDYAFSAVNSSMFRDYLSQCSGIDLIPFFDNWIFNPGFPHFSIDSLKTNSIQADSGYDVIVYIRQKLRHAPAYFRDVPVEVTFFDSTGNYVTRSVKISGKCSIFKTTLNFKPHLAVLDFNEKISDAITAHHQWITQPGSYDFGEALLEMEVEAINGTAFIRAEHNWVPPDHDSTLPAGIHLSRERYWRISGIIPDGFRANFTIKYNGSTSGDEAYLDRDLTSNSEDSLLMVYREGPGHPWAIVDSFLINTQGSSQNKRGSITIFNWKSGEYALAIYDRARPDSVVVFPDDTCKIIYGTGFQNRQPIQPLPGLDIFPNPGQQTIMVSVKSIAQPMTLTIINRNGQEVFQQPVDTDSDIIRIDTSGLSPGIYFVNLYTSANQLITGKVFIARE